MDRDDTGSPGDESFVRRMGCVDGPPTIHLPRPDASTESMNYRTLMNAEEVNQTALVSFSNESVQSKSCTNYNQYNLVDGVSLMFFLECHCLLTCW